MRCIPPNPRRVGYIDPIHGPLDGPLYMGSHIHQQLNHFRHQWWGNQNILYCKFVRFHATCGKPLEDIYHLCNQWLGMLAHKHILFLLYIKIYVSTLYIKIYVSTDRTDAGSVPQLSRFFDLLLPSLLRNRQSFGEEEKVGFQNNCIFLQHPLSIKLEHLSSQYCSQQQLVLQLYWQTFVFPQSMPKRFRIAEYHFVWR